MRNGEMYNTATKSTNRTKFPRFLVNWQGDTVLKLFENKEDTLPPVGLFWKVRPSIATYHFSRTYFWSTATRFYGIVVSWTKGV
jgi:hypothetical protein